MEPGDARPQLDSSKLGCSGEGGLQPLPASSSIHPSFDTPHHPTNPLSCTTLVTTPVHAPADAERKVPMETILLFLFVLLVSLPSPSLSLRFLFLRVFLFRFYTQQGYTLTMESQCWACTSSESTNRLPLPHALFSPYSLQIL